MKQPTSLHCIACGKELDLEHGPEGVYLRGCGNWASSVFDSLQHYSSESKLIEVIVCDDCLKEHSDRVWHVTRGSPQEKYEPFSEVIEQEKKRLEESEGLRGPE